jgi:hypothetical protein
MKVDFGDFQFMRIVPKVVRYVSGVATALLGSGGVFTIAVFYFLLLIIVQLFFQLLLSFRGARDFDTLQVA